MMDGWACTNCLNMIITLQFYIDLLYFRLYIHIVDIKKEYFRAGNLFCGFCLEI